jgi:SAM-dependent methyltransferase
MAALFDHRIADRHRRRALAGANAGADFLLSDAVAELVDRLSVVQRKFARGVDLMTPLPGLAQRLGRGGQVGTMVRLDRLQETAGEMPFAVADAEALPLGAASVDLVASALALQSVIDLPGALAQIRFALRPDGLLLAALLGGDTLTELRQSLTAAEEEIRGGAAPRVVPFAGVRELGALLHRAGFALPVADHDRLTVRYDNAVALMRDLRAMGATNMLAETDRRPLTRAIVERTNAIYAERFAGEDGRIPASFDLIWLSGWAPDESQQKALRPGSAKTRLADALGAAEISAGEKAKPRSS